MESGAKLDGLTNFIKFCGMMQNVMDPFTNWSSRLVCNLAVVAWPAVALSGAQS